jgi:peroxiredoxin
MQRSNVQSEQPSSDRASSLLQTSANIAVIALCIVVGWLAFKRLGSNSPPALPIYSIGESIDRIPGVDFRVARSTLVMVIREDCHFCKESLPFYRALSDARSSRPNSGLQVAVASTDSQKSLSAFLKTNGIEVDQVSTIQPGALKVPGTPTLLLVDQAGKIVHVWRGKLPDSQEREVLKVLGLTG